MFPVQAEFELSDLKKQMLAIVKLANYYPPFIIFYVDYPNTFEEVLLKFPLEHAHLNHTRTKITKNRHLSS